MNGIALATAYENNSKFKRFALFGAQFTQAGQFLLRAPDAQRVEITGDFNHWRPLPMQRLLDGWWFKRLELSHGHHLYRFIVDGKPELDPAASGVGHDEQDERASLVAVS